MSRPRALVDLRYKLLLVFCARYYSEWCVAPPFWDPPDFPVLNVFTDEVVVHFDMFSSGVKHEVASEVYTAHIVTENANRILNGNAQVL